MKYYIGTKTKSRNVISRVNLALGNVLPSTCSLMYAIQGDSKYCTPLLEEWMEMLTPAQLSKVVDDEPSIREDAVGLS